MEYGPIAEYEGPDELRQRLALVRARLTSQGLAIAPTSWLTRFEGLVARFAAGELAPDCRPRRDLVLLLEGARDFGSLALVAESLLPTGNRTIHARLRLALGDGTRAHEALFALHVAVLCRRAGLKIRPRSFGLVVILDGGTKLGIIAKRARRERSLSALVRQAGKQLAAARLTGLLALNLDALAPAAYSAARGGPQPLPLAQMHATLTRSLPSVLVGASGLPLLATLLSVTLPCALPETLELGCSTATQLRVIAWPTPVQTEALMRLHTALAPTLAAA